MNHELYTAMGDYPLNTEPISIPFRKGQKVMFEGEEANVVRVHPLVVIKTKSRVVCGALHEQCAYV